MKKKLIFILFVLLFVSISLSTIAFTFPKYNNQHINYTTYKISWLNDTTKDWKCFKLFEDGVALNKFNLNISDNITHSDGNYSYYIFAYNNTNCEKDEVDSSETIFLIVDTTPPVVESKTPTGSNEPLTGNLVLSFNEQVNTSTLSVSSDSSNISFDLSSVVWTDSDKTATVPYTATNQGELFTVNFGVKDLAGNVANDSLQFRSLVKPTAVSITSPVSGASVVQGDSLAFTVNVSGAGGKPVTGGVVTVSGDCSENSTLTEPNPSSNPGVYTGSCVVSDYGSNEKFIVTALNGGQKANASISLNVSKKEAIAFSLVSPTNTTFTRGEGIPITVKVTADSKPVTNAVVTSPSVTFTHLTGGEYKGTLQTTYSTPLTTTIRVSATATINNQHPTTSKQFTFHLNPATLTIHPIFLENGKPSQVIHSGKIVALKIQALYPNGEPAEGNASGSVIVVSNAKQSQPLNLTFTKQGNYYITPSLLTAGDYDSSYVFSVTFTDAYGNQGVMQQSVLGPAKGLKFIPDEDELVFAPGESVVIKGKVRDELNQKFLTDATIIFQNKSYSFKNGEYEIPFKVSPNESVGTKTLNLLIHTSSLDYPFPLTVTISNSLKVIMPEIVEKNVPVAIQILYPDGAPVKQGNFSVVTASGKAIPLKKNKEGEWVASLDLGSSEGVSSLSLRGTDSNGNSLNQQEQVQYKITTVEKVKQEAPLIIAGLIGFIAIAFIISYFYTYSKAKSKIVLSKEQVIEKYKKLLFEKEKTSYLKTLITYSVMTKQISKEEQPKLEADLVKTKQDLDVLISEMEEEYPYLKEKKVDYSKEALEKIEKLKPIIKDNLTEELKEQKALTFIKQKLNYGLDEETVKKQVVEQFKEAGESAVEKATVIGLFSKKEEEIQKAQEEVEKDKSIDLSMKDKEEEELVELSVKLLRRLPEFRVKQAMVDEGISEEKAQEIIDKAKQLLGNQ